MKPANCKLCGDEFNESNKVLIPTGYRFACKPCHAMQKKAYYQKKETKIKEYQRNRKRKIAGKAELDSFAERLSVHKIVLGPPELYSFGEHAFSMAGDLVRFWEKPPNQTNSKAILGKRGYLVFNSLGGAYFHRVVAERFLGKSDLPVNHKDGNRLNNDIGNLEYISGGENSKHARYELKKALKKAYKNNNKTGRVWYSRIVIDGESKYLGSFFTREEAEAAFDKAEQEAIACYNQIKNKRLESSHESN